MTNLHIHIAGYIDKRILETSGMGIVKFLAPAILLISFIQGGVLGIPGFKEIRTGCNTVWTSCVSAAGGVAGVSTGGVGVPATILACNAAQTLCMAIRGYIP